jgi:hypothetical protein
MALWHMDRARYYASVGDDARALRHLSKFGTQTKELKELDTCNANLKDLRRNCDAQETFLNQKLEEFKKAALMETTNVKMCEGNTTTEGKMLCYRRVGNNLRDKTKDLEQKLKEAEEQKCGKLMEDLEANKRRETSARNRLQREIAEMQKKLDESEAAATSSEARKSKSQGGCSVM